MLIAIYTGYSPKFNNDNYSDPEISKHIGGSEYAVIYLSREFAKRGHEVYVANPHIAVDEYLCRDGVKYCSFDRFNKISLSRTIDMLIISRYINAFIHCFIRAKKVYLWLHDVIIHDAYNGHRLPNCAGNLASNLSVLNGISGQNEWHINTLKHIYAERPELHDKFFAAPNGVDQELIEYLAYVRSNSQAQATSLVNTSKIKDTFIYASHHSRGLDGLMKIWPFILSVKPNAKLFIYGERVPETQALTSPYETSVTVYEKTPHLELFKKMMETEFWIYPTNFPETFCMVALEAQLAGCKCICSDSGALKNTIGKYGVIMRQESTVNEWIDVIMNAVWSDEFLEEQVEYASKQTWSERAELWLNL
jgi:glycosyltransferase involved in cell wall biosynthesis